MGGVDARGGDACAQDLASGTLGTHLLPLGQSIDITAPLDVGTLDIVPTFSLMNTSSIPSTSRLPRRRGSPWAG